MPIDATSDPYDVANDPDPVGAKIGGPAFGRIGEDAADDDDPVDDDLAGAGSGAKAGLGAADVDDDLDGAGTGARAGVDISGFDKSGADDLDSAGSGAKFDPSAGDDDGDPTAVSGRSAFDVDDLDGVGSGSGKGSELFEDDSDDGLDLDDDSPLKNVDFGDDDDGDLTSLKGGLGELEGDADLGPDDGGLDDDLDDVDEVDDVDGGFFDLH